MSHLVLELALWVLLAFFVGCIIGCLLRRSFAAPTEGPVSEASGNGEPEASASVATEEEPLALSSKPERPKGIAAARDGKPDNLQRISGIGPKNEKTLHGLGFFHFDQIAAWTADEIAWVDDHLKFNGRILREEWTEQAKLLAQGDEEEFRRLYGTGGLRNKKGETEPGSRTRKN